MIENKDDLLLCVGFIGKLQVNSSTRTKLDLNKYLEIFGSRLERVGNNMQHNS